MPLVQLWYTLYHTHQSNQSNLYCKKIIAVFYVVSLGPIVSTILGE